MQVKKFEAPTIQEALDAIKRELGPEAIILQTKKHKKGFGLLSRASVEVTAAVSDRSVEKKEVTKRRMPEKVFQQIERMPSSKQVDLYDKAMEKHLRAATESAKDRVEVSKIRYADIDGGVAAVRGASGASTAPAFHGGAGLQKEVSDLRVLVQAMMKERSQPGREKIAFGEGVSAASLEEIFEQLTLAGVDRRHAHALVKKAAFELGTRAQDSEVLLDQVAGELMAGIETLSWLGEKPTEGPRVFALVGPTGVGKTTTLAKIASEAILRRGLKVGLINLDSYKVAAFDQLATYAKILKAPFRSASSQEDIRAAVADFQGLDLVLIDTTGRSQRDPASLKEMRELLDVVPGLETGLVMSATTRDAELHDGASRFGVFHPRGLIFSKLDEATTFGCIYNVSQKSKLPLMYFTTGQRVPEDLEEATPERLVALILDL